MTEIQEKLFALSDPAYVDFIAKSVPTVEKEKFIGVRSPAFKKFFAAYCKQEGYMDFIRELPHAYYEENMLHAALLGKIKDFDSCVKEVERFLPFLDNWAVCDSLTPAVFDSNHEKVWQKVQEWTASGQEFIVRFGIRCLLGFLRGEDFSTEQLDLAARVPADDYYVQMMVAWYFAEALTFQYEKTVPYIENRVLSAKVHRKAIQKAVESFRIPDDRKEYLKSLRK